MNLMQRALEVDGRLSKVAVWKKHAKSAGVIEQRRSEWNEQSSKLQQVLAQLDWLCVKEQAFGAHQSEVSKLAGSVQQCLAWLETNDNDVEALTAGDQWVKTLATAKKCVETLREYGRGRWKEVVSQHGTFQSAQTINAKMPQSRKNIEALGAYQPLFRTYSQLAGQDLPSSADHPQRVAELASGLNAMISRFDFEVHPEVNAFFVAINSAQGASLLHLTPIVLAYLSGQGDMQSYVVRNRA